MPIYEYYCPTCDGRFSHLARRPDAPPPPCPGCGSRDVEKLVSRVNLGRSDTERRADYQARSREVDQEDSREVAKFLQQAGDLAGESTPIDQEAFQEIVARRAEGAKDEDLQDIVDAIPFPSQTFAHPHDPGHECEGSCGEAHTPKKRSSRRTKDLGWA